MFNNYYDMVTIEEMCEMLRIGRSKAYEFLRTGEVEGFKKGRVWMIPKQAIIDFVENSRRESISKMQR